MRDDRIAEGLASYAALVGRAIADQPHQLEDGQTRLGVACQGTERRTAVVKWGGMLAHPGVR